MSMLFADIDEIIDGTLEEKPIPDNEIRPYDGMTTLEQLNLYRNLHYCEGLANERGIIANAINDIIVQFDCQKAEIEELQSKISSCNAEMASCKAEAAEDFAKLLKQEIAQALESNYKARAERMCNTELYAADTFISYCNGKIDCLRGLDGFIDNLLQERLGDTTCEHG